MTYDVIDRARRRTRRRVTTAALVVVAVTAAASAGVLALRHDDPSRSSTDAGPTSELLPTDASAVRLPADLRWVSVAGVSVPVSDQAGPRDTSGGRARSFSHDEPGAVLAAVHLTLRVAPQLGPAVFEPTIREQVTGPDAAAMLSRIGQEYDHLRANAGVAYGQPIGRLESALRGYRMTSYSPQEASVQILTEATGGDGQAMLAASSVQVRWTGSGWALLAPPGGDFTAVVSRAENPADYHPLTPGR